MTSAAKNRWVVGLRRLRLALLGDDLDATDILDRSRARVRHARDALEQTALRPRCRPAVRSAPPPPSGADGDEPNYFALILDGHGAVSTHRLLAGDDGEAVRRARAQADRRAFDLWDGWRFIERIEAAIP